jgi:outer membrane protein TolC
MLAGLLVFAAVLPAQAQPLELSLENAIDTALKNNLGVQIQSYDYRILGENAEAQYGLLDWNSFATLSTSEVEQATADVTQSSNREAQVANFGVEHTFSTGTNLQIGFNNARSSEDAVNFVLPTFYSASIGLRLTQPLLRDFGVDTTRRGINIAKNNLGISHEAFRTVLLETINAVEDAYYTVMGDRLNLEVQRQSLDLAKEQERITQIRIDVGADAPLDILQPQVSIAEREQDVLLAEAALFASQDTLRRLINLPLEEWDREIVPTATLDYSEPSIDVQASLDKALTDRPELIQARLTQANRQISQNFSRNQVLPTLDLSAGYRYSGLDKSYSDAFSQITDFDFPSWDIQLQFGLPILNTQARANARAAQLELERSYTSEAQTRQQIIIEVRQAIRDIDTAYKGIVVTNARRDAAEKNLDAERKRFDNGMSTNFDVLRVQNDLAAALSAEIRARTGYKRSVTRYHRAIGDLLEVRGIELQAPAEYDLPESRFAGTGWLNYGEAESAE